MSQSTDVVCIIQHFYQFSQICVNTNQFDNTVICTSAQCWLNCKFFLWKLTFWFSYTILIFLTTTFITVKWINKIFIQYKVLVFINYLSIHEDKLNSILFDILMCHKINWYNMFNCSLISTYNICLIIECKHDPKTVLHTHLQLYDLSLEWKHLFWPYLEGLGVKGDL